MPPWSEARKYYNRRRLHARRVYKRDPLFAVQIIRQRYPDYDDEMLLSDLRRRTKKKEKPKKKKTRWDLRYRQIEKLKLELRFCNKEDAKAYNKICHQLQLLCEADKARRPIKLKCKLEGEVREYSFHWSTSERGVKAFVAAANVKGTTHEALVKKAAEINSL